MYCTRVLYMSVVLEYSTYCTIVGERSKQKCVRTYFQLDITTRSTVHCRYSYITGKLQKDTVHCTTYNFDKYSTKKFVSFFLLLARVATVSQLLTPSKIRFDSFDSIDESVPFWFLARYKTSSSSKKNSINCYVHLRGGLAA
jgi:hypothetical protein